MKKQLSFLLFLLSTTAIYCQGIFWECAMPPIDYDASLTIRSLPVCIDDDYCKRPTAQSRRTLTRLHNYFTIYSQ